MSDTHIITAVFHGTALSSVDSRYQYDYGQTLRIEGVDLPEAFEAHFSNSDTATETITMIGSDNSVSVPDELLQTGLPVFCWIYLHDEETDGRTVYKIRIPIKARPEITNEEPTPIEQSAITQAIAALDSAVDKCEDAVTHYPKIVNRIWYVWDADEQTWVNTGIQAEGVDGYTPRKGIDYEDGIDGVDGISPVITTQQIPDGHIITIVDAQGTHRVDLHNGVDGRDGIDGTNGRDGVDGFTPQVSVTQSGRTRIVTITDKSGSRSYQVLDGVSPLVVPAPITGGYKLTIYDAEGSRSVNVYNGLPGETGQDGAPGRDGVSPTVSEIPTSDGYIVMIEDATGVHEFSLVNGQDGQDGEPGQDGVDGVSPEIYVNDITGGHEVTVVDAQGETSFDVLDGADGVSPLIGVEPDQGGYHITIEDVSGESDFYLYNGQDGYSPTVTVTPITGGHQVDIEDGEGTQTFDVMNGQDGHGEDGSSAYASVSKSGKTATITLTDKNGTTTAQVSDGEDGQDGDTPEKGVDYWTASDKAEIVSDVEDALEDTIDQASVSYSAVTPTDAIQWEQGMINTSTGADASGTTRMRTVGYIPVWGGATIETSKPSAGGIVPIFYHADKSYHYCPSKSKYLSSYTVPEKTYKYMRVMMKMDGSNDALTVADAEANVTIKCGVLQHERSLLKGKTLIFTGDSIPQGQISGGTVAVPYPQIVALQLGMTLKNYSIGATTIASKDNYGGAFATVEEFNAAAKDTSLYYQVIDGQDYTTYKYSDGAWTTTSTQVRTPLCERFDLMDDDGDVIVVAAGTNDFQYSWTDVGDMSSRSNHTFYGAMHNICLGLLEKYFKKQIIFCTPLKRAQSPYTSQTDVNENGLTLKDYCNIIKEVCDYYSIPVVDLNSESGLNPELSIHAALFDNVSTHPLQPAHNMLGLMMTERIRACGGNRGIDGEDGHTPVKGTDYWTAQDQQDIVDDVVEEVTKTVTVTGTTPTITGVANTRYVCGEVSTLSITPPASGIIDVLFTSGSTKTVLTLPSTVQMPSGFDTEPDTVYEISIMDGVYGAVMSWEVSA